MWSLILLIFALSFEYGSPVKTNVRNGPNVHRNTSLPLTFDFIVLGSGTAGSVVANRLSASGQYTVLLLEAGTYVEDEPLVSIPYNWGMTVGSSLDRNDLMAVDDPVVKYDLNKRHLASGKALGGTSTINTEMYVRGNPLDYDLWAEQVGTDWNYENVLPYFRRVENSSRYATNPTYHGNQGALHLSPGGYEPIEDMLLVQACLALNMTFVEDWNGAEQITSPSGSVGFHELTIFNGTRQTAFGTYVLPHETSYQCVDWYDLETRQAHTTLATKEIIVSMGALRSPQLLLLSGIGNATELNKLGIPVVQDLSGVGENLQDHVITTALWKFIRTKFQSVSDLRADIRIIARTPSGTSLFALAYLIRPHSRGRITLVSRDPTDAPIVQMNYFSDPDSHDVNVLMEGIRRVHEIVSTAPMRNSGFASFANLSDDEQFKNYLFGNEYSTGNSNSGYHFVGTCKMADDSMAVVDARLRVRGIVGLRVIDASIMPFVTSGNTQAPVYRIGEKGAQMILDDNNHT